MKKVEILRTLLLLGIVCVLVSFHFLYYENDIYNENFRAYNGETIRYPSNSPYNYYNETVELMPPEWLLELYNISLNESFKP